MYLLALLLITQINPTIPVPANGQLEICSKFKHGDSVTLNRIVGATDGFDKGLDKQVGPFEGFYSSISGPYNLRVDARDPTSITSYYLSYTPNKEYVGDFWFDLIQPFTNVDLEADIFLNNQPMFTDIDIMWASENNIRYPVSCNPGDTAYININLTPIPEPSTIIGVVFIILLGVGMIVWRLFFRKPRIEEDEYSGYYDYDSPDDYYDDFAEYYR